MNSVKETAASLNQAIVAPTPQFRRIAVVLAGLALVTMVLVLWLAPADAGSRFMAPDGVPGPREWVVPTRLWTAVLLGLATLAAAVAVRSTAKVFRVAMIGFASAAVVALVLGLTSDLNNPLSLTELLAFTLTASVALAFGALGGVLSERSGIINISIEGQLLMGAFLAAIVGTATGNAYVGLIAAPVGGALVGLVLAVFSIRYRVDQIIVGVVLNVLVIGVTNFLFTTFVVPSSLNSPPLLAPIAIPGLAKIPVLGPVLFNQNVLVYGMFAAALILQFALFRTRWGLRLRAVGEHPRAADTVGIKVNRTRYLATTLGSALAGLGGASFVAAALPFVKEMTGGRGYIALAAMILGRWSPGGALGAALFFGFADSLNRTVGTLGSVVPSTILQMLPYLATIFAVAGLVGRVRPPAAEGKPYP